SYRCSAALPLLGRSRRVRSSRGGAGETEAADLPAGRRGSLSGDSGGIDSVSPSFDVAPQQFLPGIRGSCALAPTRAFRGLAFARARTVCQVPRTLLGGGGGQSARAFPLGRKKRSNRRWPLLSSLAPGRSQGSAGCSRGWAADWRLPSPCFAESAVAR